MPGIVPPPAIPTLTVGGRVFTDVKNLIVLTGTIYGASNGSSGFRRFSGSSGYLPSGSKSFRIMAIRTMVVTTGNPLPIFYCDNDLGMGTNTSPTNPVYPSGDAQNVIINPTAAGTGWYEIPFDFLTPNGKYIGVTNGGTASSVRIQLFGYEE